MGQRNEFSGRMLRSGTLKADSDDSICMDFMGNEGAMEVQAKLVGQAKDGHCFFAPAGMERMLEKMNRVV